MPWYLYLALKQLFPTGRRFSFFTAISMVSVALGVMLLIVVLSVMGGFQFDIHQMVQNTQGDVEVRSGGLIQDPRALESLIEKVPGVVATTPFAEGVAVLEFENKPTFPSIHGFDLNTVTRVMPLDRYIIAGSLDNLDDDSVILSSQLAESIGARLGDTVEIDNPILILEQYQKGDQIMLPSKLKVIGIFQIGHQQLDSSTVIVTLRRMSQLYGLTGGAVHGIDVKLAEGLDADVAAARINDAFRQADGGRLLARMPGLRARSWKEIMAGLLWVLQLEKNMMLFIMLFVVLVAAFLTMSLLLVLVIKKTREIGLLGALGANRRQIALCFCLQGVAIGVVGTAVGVALGYTFGYYRDDVIQLLTRFTGSRQLLEQFYQFSELPWHPEAHDIAVIVITSLVLSTLAGLIPAIIAARLKPVEALRHE